MEDEDTLWIDKEEKIIDKRRIEECWVMLMNYVVFQISKVEVHPFLEVGTVFWYTELNK